MQLDIQTAIQTATIIALVAAVFSLWQGIRNIQKARELPFFRMRRETSLRGWRLLGWAIFLPLVAFLLNNQLENAIYRFYPPTATVTITPTITLTPTISLTPTITLSPTITLTPSVSDTPTITPTPFIPLAIQAQFESTVTPNPQAIFSELQFTDGLDSLYRPINPGTEFQNPIDHMYAVFSYDGMIANSQWSALWIRNGELVHYETKPWDGGTGGLGYTDWQPDPSEWHAGIYEVQIFAGLEFKRSGFFSVIGEPPTPQPTQTSTPTPTATRTPTPTRTLRPTFTLTPTRTLRPTSTITPVPSPTRTRTPYLSPTPTPSRTPWPTATPNTPLPSVTPQPTRTYTPVTPSITPQPTRTRTPTPTPRQ